MQMTDRERLDNLLEAHLVLFNGYILMQKDLERKDTDIGVLTHDRDYHKKRADDLSVKLNDLMKPQDAIDTDDNPAV